MFLSIIVPVYNTENYVEDCVLSLLHQDMNRDQYEIICVNDGSTDNSLKILRQMQREYPNIVILDQCNKGVSEARNAGLRAATGEYVWFVDSDDLIRKNVFGKIQKSLTDEKCDVLSVGLYTFDDKLTADEKNGIENGRITSEYADIAVITHILRREYLIKQECSFQREIAFGEDTLFIYQVMRSFPKEASMREVVYLYRKHEGSATTTDTISIKAKKIKSFGKLLPELLSLYQKDRNDRIADLLMSNLWMDIYTIASMPRRIGNLAIKDLASKGLFPFARPKECTLRKSYATNRIDLVGKVFDYIYTHCTSCAGMETMRLWYTVHGILRGKQSLSAPGKGNVLVMADYRTNNSGNFIASLLELANRLKAEGKRTIFLFPARAQGEYPWAEWLEREGHTVSYLPDGISDIDLYSQLCTIIAKNEISIIHTHFGFYLRFLRKYYKNLGNVCLIVHDHMDFALGHRSITRKLRYYAHAMLYRMNGIVVVSVMKAKDHIYRFAGKNRHWFIPNGLSYRRNSITSKSREEIREELGLSRDERLCLFLGWDMKGKGLDIALQAVNMCRKQNVLLVLGIIGHGSNPDKSKIQHMTNMSGVSASSSWIRFMPSVEDIFAYDRAADVYLSASRKDAFSYGILEAISQNTPVVMSDIEGTSWARAYEKCFVYPVEDANACAKALREAVKVKDSESNAEDVVEQYSIDRWCDRIIDVYKQIDKDF